MGNTLKETLHWTLPQLKRAYKKGEVVGMKPTIDHIEFLLKGGIQRGVLVEKSGTVKRFKNESVAWNKIDSIKGDSLHQEVTPPVREMISIQNPYAQPAANQKPLTLVGETAQIDWDYWLERRPLVLELNGDVPHYLMLPEVHYILHHAKDLELHFLIDTLWHTGARISEVLALTRESFHLDDERNSYVILTTLKQKPPGRPKKDAPKSPPKRKVPIVNPLYIEAVTRYVATQKPTKSQPLFSMTRHNVGYRLKALGNQLDLPIDNLTPHVFRHSFAINALIQGRTEKTIQGFLGHKNRETTQLYLKVLSGEEHHLMYGMQF